MTKEEEEDFIYFKENQLANINLETGQIDVYKRTKSGSKILVENIGSKNPDGYIRFWANETLRMKHRFIFWYVYGYLPEEINHKDSNRSNNSISNLEASNRSLNNAGRRKRTFTQLTDEEVHSICQLIKQGESITKVAKLFSKSRSTIRFIIKGKFHKAISALYF